MSGARVFLVICSALFLASCSANSFMGAVGQKASALLAPIQVTMRQPSGDFVANEDAPYSLQLRVEDVDIPYGDKLTFSMVQLPDWLGLSRDGLLKGTPDNADVGPHEIIVRVTDRSGQSDDAIFIITVVNTNDAPKFVTTSLPAAIQDNAYEMAVEVTDDDIQHGDVMRFKLADGPDWLLISKDGMLGGTPANGDVGDHIVVVELSDKAGTSIQKEFKLKVENVNDAPVFITSNRK
jgi:hypothetical protein